MARQPSDEAFSEFVHAAWPGLYRTAYLLLGDRGLAEDLVQTALAKTYAAWPRVRDVQAAPGYARTTLVNTASSWFRKRSWRNEVPTRRCPRAVHDADPSRPAVRRRPGAPAAAPAGRGRAALLRGPLASPRPPAPSAVSDGTVKSQTSHALAKLRGLLGDAVIPRPREPTMTDRLSALLHEEADHLDVPPADAAERPRSRPADCAGGAGWRRRADRRRRRRRARRGRRLRRRRLARPGCRPGHDRGRDGGQPVVPEQDLGWSSPPATPSTSTAERPR